MAGKITAIKPQKRNADRINVYLDGEFAFGLAAYAAAGLEVGMWLSDEKIAELQADDTQERAHNRALDYLSYRPRSADEVRRYLLEREFGEVVVEEELERLRRVNLVDDVAFARYWVENRFRFRPRGRRMLAYELRQKGVASPAIEEALADYDEVTAVETVAREQARRLTHLEPELFRRRLYARLARRGFSHDLIQDAFATLDFPNSDH